MHVDPVLECYEVAALALQPPPTLTLSEWAEANRILHSDYAAEPGPYRRDRTPYLIEPMDRLSVHDPCREVVTLFPSQVGKTTVLENWLGYIVDLAPAPTMLVQPSDDDCRDWSTTRLDLLIRDTPSLVSKVDSGNEPGSVNNTLNKRFRGGRLYLKGTNSSSKSRSKAIKFMGMDEIDAFKNLPGEGDIVGLFEKRVTSFGSKAKLYKSSTPTDEPTSRIWREYLASDQHEAFFKLPCCNSYQRLKYEHLIHPHKTRTGRAQYQCPFCGKRLDEHTKAEWLSTVRWMPWLANDDEREAVLEAIAEEGEVNPSELEAHEWELSQHPLWVAKAQRTRGKKLGYQLNGLCSPYGWLSWDEICEEHSKATQTGDPELLQVWTNTRMAEVWRGMSGDKVDDKSLTRFCVPYERPVPEPVKILTAGVDVQKDWIEAIVAGWDETKSPWAIGHAVLYGDPEQDDVWSELRSFLFQRFDGYRISAACIDSGYLPDRAYRFCGPLNKANIWASKGLGDTKAPIVSHRQSSIKRKGGTYKLMQLGVHRAKKRLMERLQKEPGTPGCFHFPDEFSESPYMPEQWFARERQDYFAQLTAEALHRFKRGGAMVEEWRKTRERNEVLDCWVYAYAAHTALVQQHYTPKPRMEDTEPTETPPKRKQPYLERRKKWF